MTPKQNSILKICFVIFAISMAVMAISTIIDLIRNGWEALNVISFVPFIALISAFSTIFANKKMKDHSKDHSN